jgi:hypothetical protein
MTVQAANLVNLDLSVAMTDATHQSLIDHLLQHTAQEDLAFAYWRPSKGGQRYSAILFQIVLPDHGERTLHGNASFTGAYLRRVLRERPPDSGVAFLHSHLSPGWQGMSQDDIVAERDRIGSAASGHSGLPLLGLTLGIDGTWSARMWSRAGPNRYERKWATDVRVVGQVIKTSRRDPDSRGDSSSNKPIAMHSVWGDDTQSAIARARVGIVGLGSVGSIVCESLARMGIRDLTLIDHDHIESRNLDRTIGAQSSDIALGSTKVEIAARNFASSATSDATRVKPIPQSLLTREGIAAALDCDILFSCVDRPLPRHVLNTIAYSHLIPVIDGGIIAKVDGAGRPLHVDWRIHTVGPDHRCLVCLGAVSRSDIALDRDGLLDDPDYINNLPEHDRLQASRRNIFAFSLSVAAHMSLQFAKLSGAGDRIGGIGPQRYHAYPGTMSVEAHSQCESDCEYASLICSAVEPGNILPFIEPTPDVPATGSTPSGGILSILRRIFTRPVRITTD